MPLQTLVQGTTDMPGTLLMCLSVPVPGKAKVRTNIVKLKKLHNKFIDLMFCSVTLDNVDYVLILNWTIGMMHKTDE